MSSHKADPHPFFLRRCFLVAMLDEYLKNHFVELEDLASD